MWLPVVTNEVGRLNKQHLDHALGLQPLEHVKITERESKRVQKYRYRQSVELETYLLSRSRER